MNVPAHTRRPTPREEYDEFLEIHAPGVMPLSYEQWLEARVVYLTNRLWFG
jgi:hypothetical protein